MSDKPAIAPHECAYCGKAGADRCVRLSAPTSGSASPVYAHEGCAGDRGIKPLYRLTAQHTVRLDQAS
ncbi:hypothetical protein [Streptomyces sp. NPDC002221]|uniref:hypothetical protein n=1 Tax=Streptomyces sp. NPDC002221 TaxID=3364639 RepID=UPI00367A1B6F